MYSEFIKGLGNFHRFINRQPLTGFG